MNDYILMTGSRFWTAAGLVGVNELTLPLLNLAAVVIFCEVLALF